MADAAPPIARVAHVILRVSDLPRSTAFYRDTLGLTLQFAFPGFAFFAGGGVSLALNENRELAAAAGPAVEIAFECPDIRAAWTTLSARGVAFSREPRVVSSDATHDLLATDFRDPDGHVLSLTGRVPKGR